MRAAPAAHPRGLGQRAIGAVTQRVMNVVKSHGQRAVQASRTRTQREVGNLLRKLSEPSKNARTDFLHVKETIAALTSTMRPMTSRGEDYEEEFRKSVRQNLKEMSSEEIDHLRNSLDEPREPLAHLDPNHFVLRHLRDIRSAVADHLGERPQDKTAADPLAGNAARQTPVGPNKGANPRLLKPLPRDKLGAALAPRPEAPQAPLKPLPTPRRVLQPGRDFNPHLLARPSRKDK